MVVVAGIDRAAAAIPKPLTTAGEGGRMSDIHPDQRVAVLADSQNLYHSAQSVYSRNIDYSGLLDGAVADRSLVRAIAYVIRADSPEEESFFEALRDIGFETKIKEIKTFADGSKKADWDLGMSLDAVSLASHVDAVVLCTGDGDFARLCSHLRHEGVRVEAMGFGNSAADELIEAADDFVDLAEDEEQFLL
jgi:uncharacterized LabA/DUF88 family protein